MIRTPVRIEPHGTDALALVDAHNELVLTTHDARRADLAIIAAALNLRASGSRSYTMSVPTLQYAMYRANVAVTVLDRHVVAEPAGVTHVFRHNGHVMTALRDATGTILYTLDERPIERAELLTALPVPLGWDRV